MFLLPRAEDPGLLKTSEPITEYYLIEFLTPVHAEQAANAVSAACSTLRVDSWPFRPVIWLASPLGPTGTLYMSVGAVEIARAIGLPVNPVCRVPIEQLPKHRVLLVGEVRDRISAEQAQQPPEAEVTTD